MTEHLNRRFPITRAAHRSMIESLEQRRLLAAIEGNIWTDGDNDELRDFFEDGLAGLRVFLDLNLNSALDAGEPETLTDDEGNYRFDDLAVAEGGSTYYVRHLPFLEATNEPLAQTTPGIIGRTNVTSAFSIEVIFTGAPLSSTQLTVVQSAINVWQKAVIGDLPDVGEIDDLQLFVNVGSVDGPGGILAFAAPTAFRAPGQPLLVDFAGTPRGLPYQGEITIDISDASPSRAFVETVAHEIGHVMGIGTLWDTFLVGSGSSSVAYVGANGVEELGRLFNQEFSSVPVEPQVEGHWDEFGLGGQLGNEIMSPFASGGFDLPPDAPPVEAFSRLTIGALEDFGWEVSYGAAEPFGPFNIGPLPEDLNPEVGIVSFAIGVFLETPDTVINDAHFGVRPNDGPNPFFFQAGPAIQQQGQPVRLLAEVDTSTISTFSGDSDFRDSLIQINFYRESNGLAGLQTGLGGDVLLSEDADRTDGFQVMAETAGLDLGEVIFYARGYDEGYFTTDRALIVNLVNGQTIPQKPSTLRALATDTETIELSWLDQSVDESGFLLQVSRGEGFDIPGDVTNFYLPPQEGTGPMTFTHHVEEGSLTTRFFRVRSFNTAGSSRFAGRTAARTLSRDEVLLDNLSPGVTFTGNFEEILHPGRSVNLTFLRGSSGFVDFNPELNEAGEYFVFFRGPDLSDPASIRVSIFGANGSLIEEIEVDQSNRGNAEVLLGSFSLPEETFVRIEPISGEARVDTVRFLPAS